MSLGSHKDRVPWKATWVQLGEARVDPFREEFRLSAPVGLRPSGRGLMNFPKLGFDRDPDNRNTDRTLQIANGGVSNFSFKIATCVKWWQNVSLKEPCSSTTPKPTGGHQMASCGLGKKTKKDGRTRRCLFARMQHRAAIEMLMSASCDRASLITKHLSCNWVWVKNRYQLWNPGKSGVLRFDFDAHQMSVCKM